MSYTLQFTIKSLPRMPNQLLGSRWQTRSGHAKKWERLVWQQCWHLKPIAPLNKACLQLTRCSSRVPDFDGLVGSFKSVIDGLVKCGILLDDKQDVIGVPQYFHEVTSPMKGRVHVRVEQL